MSRPAEDLKNEPLITFNALARKLEVGTSALRTVADRAGITVTKFPNRREFVSFAEAVSIARELNNQ